MQTPLGAVKATVAASVAWAEGDTFSVLLDAHTAALI